MRRTFYSRRAFCSTNSVAAVQDLAAKVHGAPHPDPLPVRRGEGGQRSAAPRGPYFLPLALPKPFTTPFIHSTLRRVFSSVPLHSRDTTPSQPVRCRYSMHARMLSALTPPPTGTSELPMPVSSPRTAAARAGLTSLMWQWTMYLRSAWQ